MGAPEFTTCVQPKDYQPPNFPQGGIGNAILSAIGSGGFDLAYQGCDYLLHGKLVCLGDDQCAIGRVASIETVDNSKTGFEKIDNDFCLNIALCPDPLAGMLTNGEIVGMTDTATRIANLTMAQGNVQGKLIREQPGMPMPFTPDPSQEPRPEFNGNYAPLRLVTPSLTNPVSDDVANALNLPTLMLPILHVEIEGNRLNAVCTVIQTTWGPIHDTVCQIPLIGGFLCFLLSIILAPLLPLLTNLVALAWAAGSDDNRSFDNAGDLNPGDLVLVRGRWVFDAGHQGWNELHPVTFVQKLPDGPDFDSAADLPGLLTRWCGQASLIPTGSPLGSNPPAGMTAAQEATWVAQTQAENRWYFHPLIDGCQPSPSQPKVPQ